MENIPPAELEFLKGQTKGPATTIIVIVFTALAFVTVVLRFVTRFIITRNAGIEDYTIGAAMVRFARVHFGYPMLIPYRLYPLRWQYA
jgi:hypothetical protein